MKCVWLKKYLYDAKNTFYIFGFERSQNRSQVQLKQYRMSKRKGHNH